MNFTQFPNIDFIALRNELKPDTSAQFGNMKAQQMIEPVSLIYDYVLSNNKINVLTPEDKIEKVKRAFLWSEGGFKRGITNEFTKSLSFECKLEDLSKAIDEFEKRHVLVAIAINQNAIIDKTHPVFGLLNTEEWTQFFTKHTWHHFNQFGLVK
jgi:oxepin-CoA hydrolase/3-oxo-5,6-dehydrosuberyl-CoA semialdehyde dehydrogenase